ncbi:MAG TPA: hypothetical protein VHD60_02995 [Candidatus Saccharimonadales bacterium]|nr:hypothetical protein [Candidatus Saccharimonadales bacterium]
MTETHRRTLTPDGRIPQAMIAYRESGHSGLVGDMAERIIEQALEDLRAEAGLTDTDPSKPINPDVLALLQRVDTHAIVYDTELVVPHEAA